MRKRGKHSRPELARSQIVGALTLAVIVTLLTIGLQFKKKYLDVPSLASYQAEKDSLTALMVHDRQKASLPSLRLHPFDPNSVDSVELLELGMTLRQAHSFLRYRAKGKHWYRKEQLRDLFFMTDSAYAVLEPYIVIEDSVPPWRRDTLVRDSVSLYSVRLKKDTILDLNTADTAALQLIRGIGPYVACHIVRYRQELGGYSSVAQLHELAQQDKRLCGLDTLTGSFVVTADSIRSLSVNTVSLSVLTRHPYLSYSQAEVLYTYRRRHGAFRSMEEVFAVLNLSSEEERERLRPYLSVE